MKLQELSPYLLHLTSKYKCKFHPPLLPGLLLANKDYHDSKPVLLRLWIHEAFRVFADRLINRKDIFEFEEILDKVLGKHFGEVFHNTCPDRVVPIFGDFCNKDMVYEDLNQPDVLRGC